MRTFTKEKFTFLALILSVSAISCGSPQDTPSLTYDCTLHTVPSKPESKPSKTAQIDLWKASESGASDRNLYEIRKGLFKYLCSDDFKVDQVKLGGSEPNSLLTYGNGIKGIFKEFSGTWPNNSYSEVAAYKLDETFRLDIVPMTFIRKVDNKLGSVQVFMEDAESGTVDLWLRDPSLTLENRIVMLPKLKQLPALMFLDYVSRNPDRKGENYLILKSPGERLVAIDHGLAFFSDALVVERSRVYGENPQVIVELLKQNLKLRDRVKIIDKEKLRSELAPYFEKVDKNYSLPEAIDRFEKLKNLL